MIKRNKIIAKLMVLTLCSTTLPYANVLAAQKSKETVKENMTIEQSDAKVTTDSAVIIKKDDTNEKDFNFDSKTGTILQYTGNDSDVVIPDEINGVKVTAIGVQAFYSNNSVKTVIIPEGVKKICTLSFYRCYNLNKIALPDSLTDIESSAFLDCYNLSEITIPNSNVNIEYNVFSGCTNTKFYIKTFAQRQSLLGSGINESQIICSDSEFEDAFQFDSSTGTILKYNGINSNVVIPDEINGVKVTAIGNSAFSYNHNINTVVIPEGVKKISMYAFNRCYNLNKVTLPDSLTDIEYDAFSDCYNLSEITIPNGNVSIDSTAFRGCTATKFYVKTLVQKQSLLGSGINESQIIVADSKN